MKSPSSCRRALCLTVALATVAVSLSGCRSSAPHTEATVERIVDGDTIDVLVDGESRRVRLLNIDAPESVDPDQAVECLGPEAAEHLARLLPVGTAVGLAYDEERTDSYGRELAGVFTDETFVNAEMARAGLADAILVQPNERFFAEVDKARAEAEEAGVGLYSSETTCTLPGQVTSFEAQVAAAATAEPVAGATLEEINAYGATLSALAVAGGVVDRVLAGDGNPLARSMAGTAVLGRLVDRRAAAGAEVERLIASTAAARLAEEERLAAEAARVAEEQRIAAEVEAARVAEEQRLAAVAAERAAAERAAADKAVADRSAANGSTGGGSATTGSGSSGGKDGYTGCRAYGSGGTSIDAKGRPYTKIDCVTKLPIG